MNDHESFHARHTGLIDPVTIETKSVLTVGAGSIGSLLSTLLVRSGVKRIHICDFDTVSPSNICRTAYGERDIGRLKVDALRDILHIIRSDIEVDVCAQNLSDADDDVLVEWIERSDLVIAATDHPPTQSRLGALSYHRVPAIFCGTDRLSARPRITSSSRADKMRRGSAARSFSHFLTKPPVTNAPWAPRAVATVPAEVHRSTA